MLKRHEGIQRINFLILFVDFLIFGFSLFVLVVLFTFNYNLSTGCVICCDDCCKNCECCNNSNFDCEKIDCKCDNCDCKFDNCNKLGEGSLGLIIVLLVLILIAIFIVIFSDLWVKCYFKFFIF